MQIALIGDEGNTMLYASLNTDGSLFLWFEYYGRNENEGDYEFNHTVKPEEFAFIACKFGLDPGNHILANIKRINDSGRTGVGESPHKK